MYLCLETKKSPVFKATFIYAFIMHNAWGPNNPCFSIPCLSTILGVLLESAYTHRETGSLYYTKLV